MLNDSDLSCQSELDSPELEPPSVVELEPMMMTNLSHCLNGRHQTNYQTVPHHPLTPDQRVPRLFVFYDR